MSVSRRRTTQRVVAQAMSIVLIALVVIACGTSGSAKVGALVAFQTGSPQSSASVAGATATPSDAPSSSPSSLSQATPSPTTSSPTASSPANDSGDAFTVQAQMVDVIKKVNPAVVLIETDAGLGSGVIYDNKGDIVTNAHVVGTSTTFKVTLSNGKSYTGTLVGSYTPDDIAVVKISATGITPAVFGDSSKLQVGDVVLAMGNPLGLQSSVTEGIVSALSRQVSEPSGNTLPDVIQTSAAINPGNSGGALVDLQGEVVGIPTLAATDPQLGGSAPGIGFAISSNRARVIADQLIATGHVTNSGRAYLGVSITDSAQGVLVAQITAGGPAAKAGIVAGDLILSVGGQATPDTSTLLQ
ncbi:MAG TPA: trypsin-like peptidase domain-containing protein, partial [Candidatus Limnocylindrales bacterium]